MNPVLVEAVRNTSIAAEKGTNEVANREMQNDNRQYRQSLKDIALYAKGQAENVAWLQMIRDGTDEIEVADADFVIKGNAFAELSFLLGNAELNALSY